jgi:hypothetical protein
MILAWFAVACAVSCTEVRSYSSREACLADLDRQRAWYEKRRLSCQARPVELPLAGYLRP